MIEATIALAAIMILLCLAYVIIMLAWIAKRLGSILAALMHIKTDMKLEKTLERITPKEDR